jgi:hypothetical protein
MISVIEVVIVKIKFITISSMSVLHITRLEENHLSRF